MSAKEKLLMYLDEKGITKSQFCRITGLSNGFLTKGENISSGNLEIISSKFRDLNLEWVITGEGEMLRKKSNFEPEVTKNEKKVVKNGHELDQCGTSTQKTDLFMANSVASYLIKRIEFLEKENQQLEIDNKQLKAKLIKTESELA